MDIEFYVSKMLGIGKLGFFFVRIIVFMVFCNCLWVGIGNGVIIFILLIEINKILGVLGNCFGSVICVYGDENSDKVILGIFIFYCLMVYV